MSPRNGLGAIRGRLELLVLVVFPPSVGFVHEHFEGGILLYPRIDFLACVCVPSFSAPDLKKKHLAERLSQAKLLKLNDKIEEAAESQG